MADDPIPLKPKKRPPDDAIDMDSLWLDPKLGDGLVDVNSTPFRSESRRTSFA